MPRSLPFAGLPAMGEFTVPPSWRAVDFISDLHLCEALPRTFEAFAAHLRATDADAVFLLGDLFEVWVGDDARERPFEAACVELFDQTSRHRHLAFMVGNRDFLLGQAMRQDCGLHGLCDPTVLSAWGQRFVLSHGDALCLADAPYQAFRQMVRSPDWQADFLARPLTERLQIAADIRQVSTTRRRFDGDLDADIDTETAVHWLQAAGARTLIHGHTHRPGSGPLSAQTTRHVLSDWDLDHGQRAQVLRLTRHGCTRMPPLGG